MCHRFIRFTSTAHAKQVVYRQEKLIQQIFNYTQRIIIHEAWELTIREETGKKYTQDKQKIAEIRCVNNSFERQRV